MFTESGGVLGGHVGGERVAHALRRVARAARVGREARRRRAARAQGTFVLARRVSIYSWRAEVYCTSAILQHKSDS